MPLTKAQLKAKRKYRNSPKGKQKAKAYYRINRDKFKQQSRKTQLSKYNLSPEEYDKILINQGYCCAICRIEAGEFKRRLAVDHCHKTNKNRGLLCFRCNASIGKFNDNVELLESAVKYLRRYQ
jgi:Recombination endonuclease VII